MPNAQNAQKPAAAGGFRLTAFPREFEHSILEGLDRRFYIIMLISLAVVYGIVIYLANLEFSAEYLDEQVKLKYLQKFYEAEFVEDIVTDTEEEGIGGIGEEPEDTEVDERAKRDEGRRAEATGPSAAERRAQRRSAARARGQQRAAMQQAVAGTGILAELSAGGGGGTGDAVYDVLGEAGTSGGFGNLDEVLKGVGGLQTASSGSRRSQLGARSSGGGDGTGAAGIDGLIEGGAGGSGSVSITRQGSFAIKIEEGSVTGKAAKSTARSSDAISRVVNKHKDAIENCYRKEARLNPNLKGSVEVQFTISPDGKVGQVRIVNSSLRSKKVESCISRIIRRWRFQKIDRKEGSATFRQKFIFSS